MALFADHPVNLARRKAGKLPATNVWLWGQGRTPAIRPFFEVYGKHGAMITAVDLLRGLAALIGWERIEVPGATGYLDTDYAAKGRYADRGLGPDRHGLRPRRGARRSLARGTGRRQNRSAGRNRPAHRRLRWPQALRRWGDYRILVTPDHPTPLRTKTHSHGAVPFVIAGRA